MEAQLGVELFWMIALGLLIGFVAYFIYGDRGMDLWPSTLTGTAGAVITGIIAAFFEFSLPLVYAFLGSVSIIFIANAFRQEDKPVFTEIEKP